MMKKALKLFFLFLLCSDFLSNQAFAQLAVGDIAIVGVNTDVPSSNTDEFSIVTLASIPSGTTIYFSDYYWDNTNVRWGNDGLNGTTPNNTEGIIKWTTTSTIAAYTVFRISWTMGSGTPAVSGLPGAVTLFGQTGTTTFGPLGQNGDNIFIYQSNNNGVTPSNWIFGWTNSLATSVSANNAWQSSNSPILGNLSMLPSALTNGTSAISFAQVGSGSASNPSYDNNVYNIGSLRGGTKAQLLAAICTTSNWVGDESTAYDISPTSTYFTGANAFGSASPCTTPTAYAVTGGGSFCSGGSGVAVGVANSETGVTYQLKKDGANVATVMNGNTGNAISFGNQTAAGTYTVVATRTTGGCTASMSNSVAVTVNALPSFTPGTIKSVSNTATSFIIPAAEGNLGNDESGGTDRYSIVVGSSNAMPGFIPVSNAILVSKDPISVTIPASAAGTYNFNLTVGNSTTGCVSAAIPVALTVVACPSGNTLHVNASVSGGTGDGTSWANAYASLGDALAKAHTCSNIKTIKVAAGTYKPTKKPFNAGVEITLDDSGNPVTDRDNTFHIPDGVTIEGGYNAALDSRDITANVTTLSGDFNNDDVVTGSGSTLSITGNTENAYRVVLASAASSGGVGVTIDGFSIKGGNANGSSSFMVNGDLISRSGGGGIYTISGSNTLSNNTLSGNNSSSSGGGISSILGTNTLSNNTLSRNKASSFGGGIYISNGSTNGLSNNTLSGNTASNGGGIFTETGSNTLSNNTFSGNTASGNGGGIYSNDGTNTLNNNTLSGNTASSNGGGIYTNFGTNTLNNNIFWDNKKGTANNVSGADYYKTGTGNTFKNNLLQLASSNYTTTGSGNYDLGTGAAGNLFAQDPLFVNAADIDGADNIHRTADDGLALQACSPAVNTGLNSAVSTILTDIIGVTRIRQTTVDMGAYESNSVGAPTANAGADVTLTCASPSTTLSATGGSTYAWNNGATQGGTVSPTVTTTYRVTVTAANGCTATDDVTVTAISGSCCPSGTVLHVNASVSGGTGDGTSWANAYASLGDALAKAHTCSNIKTIKVAAGTYKPTKKPFNAGVEITTTDARDIVFHIPDGVTIEGGYNATGSRDITANVTTLSGDIDNNNTLDNGNAYHVVLASAASNGGVGVTIDGFSITAGNGNGSGSITVNGNAVSKNVGGGMHLQKGMNTISNNIIYSNTLSGLNSFGGGIYVESTATISNNVIYDNTITSGNNIKGAGVSVNGTATISNNTLYNNIVSGNAGSGGGINAYGSSASTISNNTLYNNTANSGGGINAGGTMMVNNNTLYSNTALNSGGAILIESGLATISNNTMYSNTAVFGGAIYASFSTNTISNNTMYSNSASAIGGGIYTYDGTNTLNNNIFWDNKKGTANNVAGADYYAYGTNGNTFKNNLLQLASSNYPVSATGNYAIGTAASGNLFAQNPLFVNAADIDGADNIHRTADDGLALSGCSPAIDAGTTTGTPSLDILGNAIYNSLKDMGAYERQTAKDAPPTASISVSNNCGNSVLNLTTNGTSFLWSNGATTEDITVSTGAAYTVTVTGTGGCKATATETAAPNAAPYGSIAVTNNCGNSILDLTASSGNPGFTTIVENFSYLWSNGATTEDITVSTSGAYTVTITNDDGCTATANTNAAPKNVPSGSIAVTNNCGNSVLDLTALSGSSSFAPVINFTYIWSNGATTQDITVSTAGAYTVTVTNSVGCKTTATETAAPKTIPTANAGADVTLSCASPSTTLMASGGVSYVWNNGVTQGGSVSPTVTTTYTVTITDSNGCTAIDAIVVNANPVAVCLSAVLSGTQTVCPNTTVNLSATISGGMAPYSLVLTNGTAPDVTVSNYQTGNPIAVTPTSLPTTYTLVSVKDASNTMGTVSGSAVLTADVTAPVFGAIPAEVTVSQDSIPSFHGFTITESNGTPIVTHLSDVSVDLPKPNCYITHYRITRTYQATDACGNSATASRSILVADLVDMSCPSDKTLSTNNDATNDNNCTTLALASNNVSPTYSDLCSKSFLSYSLSGATTGNGSGSVAGVRFNKGLTIVRYTSSIAGSTIRRGCVFNVTVKDDEAPKIVMNKVNVVLSDCDFPNPLPDQATGTDNCSLSSFTMLNDVTADLTSTCKNKLTTQKYSKSRTITWRATDAEGLITTATQIYYLLDNVAPIASCKNDITVTIGASNVTVSPSAINYMSSDNCSGPLTFQACNSSTTCTSFSTVLTFTKAMLGTANSKPIPVNLRVLDACNNSSTCATTVLLRKAGALSDATNTQDILTDIVDNENVAPTEKSIVDAAHGSLKCYPNPFSEDLNLEFNLTQDVQRLVLKVYDNQGRVVETSERGEAAAGFYQMRWNLSDLAPAMYHVCLELDGKCTKVERVIMMK